MVLKSICYCFWTKCEVLVAIATACTTMATHWVCAKFDVESHASVKTVAQKGIGCQNCMAIAFTKCDVVVAIVTVCASMATNWVCGKLDAESCDNEKIVVQMRNKGSKLLGNSFLDKNNVIVAIATACATMTTQWVCGEFNAESCDSVETVAQRGIRGRN